MLSFNLINLMTLKFVNKFWYDIL